MIETSYFCDATFFRSRKCEALLRRLRYLAPLTFHADPGARLVACEWRQEMRQQRIATELADNPGWRRLCPAVVLSEVAPCPAVFGFDMDHVVSVQGASASRFGTELFSIQRRMSLSSKSADSFTDEFASPFISEP